MNWLMGKTSANPQLVVHQRKIHGIYTRHEVSALHHSNQLTPGTWSGVTTVTFVLKEEKYRFG